MPYNLRSRLENLLLEEEEEDFGGDSSEEEDNVSEQSESESELNDTDSEEYSETEDTQNGTQDERILENSEGARGRPRTFFYSKNKTKWSSKKPTRTSGQLKYHCRFFCCSLTKDVLLFVQFFPSQSPSI